MTFLNPFLLLALPLIALPVLIHLINQRRHRTVEWGAMMFLLSARRMSKGMARLRHVLIMTARMLAIAGLIFALGRPMATGWFGAVTGGRPETVIVLLDRSASMQQQELETGDSKISSGLGKIVNLLKAYGDTKRVVLIESANNQPLEVESADSLLELPATKPTDAAADIPAMMQTALDYIADNRSGRTDIWICSDARENDWDPENGRWSSLNEGYAELKGVRFHVLNYHQAPSRNYSVTVSSVDRLESKESNELVLDIAVNRSADITGNEQIPVAVTINGTRSVVNAMVSNEQFEISGHRISLDNDVQSGWGSVELPADSNNSDNVFYFSFSDRPVKRTVIVSESPTAIESLRLGCSVASQPGDVMEAVVLRPKDVGEINWDETAMLLWHAALPQGVQAKQVASFIDKGRCVFFFPPDDFGHETFAGVSWGDWKSTETGSQSIGFWRNDDDVLQRTMSGIALPVNELKVFRYCSLDGSSRSLARLDNGDPLLVRKETDAGAAYFCSTLPVATHSSLARNGVVMFAMLHRAMAQASSSIGTSRQVEAGSRLSMDSRNMNLVSDSRQMVLAGDRPFVGGVYAKNGQLVSINRPTREDTASSLPKPELERLFKGLDYYLINDQLGNTRSLANEIWKAFVVFAGFALLLEAILCLPPRKAHDTSFQSEAVA